MNIFFNGCSYSWGDELSPTERSKRRFSKLVCEHYNAFEFNISFKGNSNDAITRTTMEWFRKNEQTKVDLAVIQWTVISRFEGYDGEGNKQYRHVTIQNDKYKNFYANYYHPQLGVDNAFKNAYLLEQFFISKGIPYVFMWHDCFLEWKERKMELNGIRWKEYDTIDPMMDYPCVWRTLLKKQEYNFIRAEKDQHKRALLINPDDFFKGGGHPNIQGHQKLAQFIIDNFKK